MAIDDLFVQQQFGTVTGMVGVNPAFGGHSGYYPGLGKVIGGKIYQELLNSEPAISTNVVVAVLETPKVFDFFTSPTAAQLKETYKNIFTRQYDAITGLKYGLNITTNEDYRIGASMDSYQVITGVRAEKTTVNYSFTDKYGSVIQEFLMFLTRLTGKDEYTQKPALIEALHRDGKTHDEIVQAVHKYGYLSNVRTGKFLYYETDHSGMHVHRAWVVVNHFPNTTTGIIESKSSLKEDGTLSILEVPMAGITVYNEPDILFMAKEHLNASLNSIGKRHGATNSGADQYSRDSLTTIGVDSRNSAVYIASETNPGETSRFDTFFDGIAIR